MSITKSDLSKFDYYLLIDRSGSMGEPMPKKAVTKWDFAREFVTSIAREAGQYDDDGITVIFFNDGHKVFDNIGGGSDNEAALKTINDMYDHVGPMGGTDTGAAMQVVFDGYLQRKHKSPAEAKPIILVIVTDGSPSDPVSAARTIVNFTQKLDNEDEAGISFLQIGDDGGARAFLKMLDEDLEKKYRAKYDIVNTKNVDELSNITIADVLLDAVNS